MKNRLFQDRKLCTKFLNEISHKHKPNHKKTHKRCILRNLSKDSLFSYSREFEGPDYQILSSR